MSDITDAVAQDAVADSLMGPPTHVVGTNPETGNASLITIENAGLEAEYIPEEEEATYRPYLNDDRQSQELEAAPEDLEPAETPEALRELEEYIQQQSPQPETQQQDGQGLSLDQAVEKFQLADPERSDALVNELAAAWNLPQGEFQIDSGKLGQTASKVLLSAASLYDSTQGNVARIPEIPPDSARELARDFLGALGADARLLPDANAQHLARVVFAGAWNLLHTHVLSGGKTDVSELNSAEAAQQWWQALNEALGNPGPVNPNEALQVADAFGRFLLSGLGKLQTPAPQTRARSARQSSGQSRRQMPRFQSNQDIFGDPEVMEFIANESRL